MIKSLQIKNFKSLVDFELKDLNPLCAFAGPNASGKTNVFDALAFAHHALLKHNSDDGIGRFKKNDLLSFNSKKITGVGHGEFPQLHENDISFFFEFEESPAIGFYFSIIENDNRISSLSRVKNSPGSSYHHGYLPDLFDLFDRAGKDAFAFEVQEPGFERTAGYDQFINGFSRISPGKRVTSKLPNSSGRLNPDGSNLPQILSNIFQHKEKQEEFLEWCSLLIPEFQKIEVRQSHDILIHEKRSPFPLSLDMISEGTFNILCILTAIYQSSEPQFICIETPENNLHPQAIEFLADLFREKSTRERHNIWISTHSPTLIRCFEAHEIVLLNKFEGITTVKQLVKSEDLKIKTDEAWLSNALGGGVLWSK